MLDIIKDTTGKLIATYKGQTFAILSANSSFNTQVNTVHYHLAKVAPHLSRDLVEYELSQVK